MNTEEKSDKFTLGTAFHIYRHVYVCDYKTGFWIDDQIYRTLLMQLVTTLYSSLSYKRTSAHSYVFVSRCSVEASNGGYFPFRTIPGFSYQFFSQQHLTTPESHQSPNSLIQVTRQRINSNDWTHSSVIILLIISRRVPHRK
jgi:hypothetical protein